MSAAGDGEERPPRGGRTALTPRHMVIVAVIFGIAYALSAALRGDVLPGIVTGILGGVLVFLVLKRVVEHNAAVRRRRERQE